MSDPISPESALLSLLNRARQAALHAYAPYSGFRVGAALRLSNGEIVTGTNVENVSFGLTICAERSALVHAVSQFGPEIRVESVAISNLNSVASPPPGRVKRCNRPPPPRHRTGRRRPGQGERREPSICA